jgi:hypothetical protein
VRPVRPHPTLYQIFARIWLGELGRTLGRRATLEDVPDQALDRLESLGIDLLYLLGVWELGAEGPRISRALPELCASYDACLPGWTDADVAGSPFAVARYRVAPELGGDAALAHLRRRLERRGIGLVLDFVPNHLARDHPWTHERPELFVRDERGAIACGRDPYFPPWLDTAQLDLRLEATREALVGELASVAARADGVRCDMAMLVLGDVFRRTWGDPASPGGEAGELWARAIDAVRASRPDFLFIAEAYWDLEWRLQLLGFDYTYDKRLYDRLLHGSAEAVRAHLRATADYQRRSVRFLENHDEPRVASLLAPPAQCAASVVAFTVPGLRFFHDGQLEGRKLRTSVHLARRAEEPVDRERVALHDALFAALRRPALREGSFAALACHAVDARGAAPLMAHRWDHPSGPIVVVVNLGGEPARGRVPLDLHGIAGRRVVLHDLFDGQDHVRAGSDLVDPERGLHVALGPWGTHLFELRR